jgi:hypothetical protein
MNPARISVFHGACIYDLLAAWVVHGRAQVGTGDFPRVAVAYCQLEG